MAAPAGNLLRGVVIAVPSGDTLEIAAQIPSGIPPRKVVKLSNVTAPRLGWYDRADEQCAWPAREALREKMIGQAVVFRIDNMPNGPSSKRVYGDVWLGEEQISQWVVGNGYATVRDVRENYQDEDWHALKAAEESAKSQHLGIWSENSKAKAKTIRNVKDQRDIDNMELFGEIAGKPIDAIVEHVRDGSTLRVLLLPSFYRISLFLAGIRTPRFVRDKESDEQTAQPFAEEAKFFTERRLLHRNVQVVLEVPDERGNFFGTVLFPMGNISASLLREGLAKVVDWSAAHVEYAAELRAAEEQAKAARLRLWRNWVPVVSSVSDNDAEFSGVVVEVPSGDTLVIEVSPGVTRRVYLSSTRAPRYRRNGDKSEPYAWDAKELLRKRTIGKDVVVELDYIRPPVEGSPYPENRLYGSVFVKGKNVAIALISKGYATVVFHREDEERSHHYDALMAAQAQAQKKNQGIHNKKKEPPIYKHNEMRRDPAKAEMLLAKFKGQRRVRGVIDYVINTARYKIFIPSEGIIIPFALLGVRTPRSNPKEGVTEPWAEEGRLWAHRLLHQRDVVVEFDSSDRGGTLFGALFLGKENIAAQLLIEGFGRVFGRHVETSPYYEVMLAAEEDARNAKRRFWETYVPPKPEPTETDADADAASSSKRGKERYEAAVTEVISGTELFVQVLGEPSEHLNALMADFAAYHAAYDPADTPDGWSPKKGAFVAAQFSLDQAWYRARVVEITETGQFNVIFIDYGNSETVDIDALRPIADSQLDLAPQAHLCKLAGLAGPPPTDDIAIADAKDKLAELVLNSKVICEVEAHQKADKDAQLSVSSEVWVINVYPPSATDPSPSDSVSASMLLSGLVRIDNKIQRPKKLLRIVGQLREFEQEAQDDRIGLWEYGVIDYDEDAKDDNRGGRGRN